MSLGCPTVAISDLSGLGASQYVSGQLKKLGVEAALLKAGARSGDTVFIGDFSFEFEPD